MADSMPHAPLAPISVEASGATNPTGSGSKTLDILMLGTLLAIDSAVLVFHIWSRYLVYRLDTLTFYLPWYEHLGERLREGDLPGWIPYIMSGAPFAGDPQSGWGYLPVMVSFTISPSLSGYYIFLSFHVLLAAIGTYFYARVIGIGPVGAMATGIAFTLGNFMQLTACCTIHMQVAVWIPAIFLCIELGLRSSATVAGLRWFALAAICTGQMIAGWLGQGAYYGCLAVAVYVLYRTMLSRGEFGDFRERVRKLVLIGSVVAVVGGATAGPAVLPRLGAVSRSNLSNLYEDLEATSAETSWDIETVPFRIFSYGAGSARWYLGAVQLTAVVVAACLCLRRRHVLFFALFGLGTLSLIIKRSPIESVFGLLPGFESLHAHRPDRILVVLGLAPAILVGWLVDTILDSPQIVRTRRLASVLAVIVPSLFVAVNVLIVKSESDFWMRRDLLIQSGIVIVAVALARFVPGITTGQIAVPRFITRIVFEDIALARFGSGRLYSTLYFTALLLLLTLRLFIRLLGLVRFIPWKLWPTIAVVIIVALLINDPEGYRIRGRIESTEGREKLAQNVKNIVEPNGAARWLQARAESGELFRFYGYDQVQLMNKGRVRTYHVSYGKPEAWRILVNNRGVAFGLQDIQGYNPVQIQLYVDLFNAINGVDQSYHAANVLASGIASPIIDQLNVKYVVVPADELPGRPDLFHLSQLYQTVYADTESRILENPNALPRAWLVHDADEEESGEDILTKLSLSLADPTRSVLLEGNAPDLEGVPAGATESVVITNYQPDEIHIQVDAASTGMVVLSEIWDPDWSATIDGTDTNIYAANYVFRGIVVEPGQHEVILRYRPRSLAWSLLLYLVPLSALTALTIGSRFLPGTRLISRDGAESDQVVSPSLRAAPLAQATEKLNRRSLQFAPKCSGANSLLDELA